MKSAKIRTLETGMWYEWYNMAVLRNVSVLSQNWNKDITNLVFPVINQNCQEKHCLIAMLLSSNRVSENLKGNNTIMTWKINVI